MLRLTQAILFSWIFFIPASLAYHWNETSGLVHGILVDYRIPTLAFSSILLVTSVLFSIVLNKRENRHEFVAVLQKTIVISLMCAFVFQLFIALTQFFTQHSVMGYLPFGEVSLSSPHIAKGITFGGVVYKLPYGTTVHPNVLAGFTTLAFLLLLTQKFILIHKKYIALFFLAASVICFLTQSITATTALILGCFLYMLAPYTHRFSVLIRLAITMIPFISILIFSVPSFSTHQNTSLSRRSDLQTITMKIIASKPLMGVGWNNFTLIQEDYGYVPSNIRFLQPVHNAFLLIIAELGVIGVVLCAGAGILIWKAKESQLPLLAALITLASFDHYLLTLTTGRMLLILYVFFYILRRRNRN